MIDYDRLCMGCMSDKGNSDVCPKCGFSDGDIQPISNLPLRYLLDGRYLIGASIESYSDSVTYIAWDTTENVPVRVHEYFPENFCDRAADKVSVAPLAGKEYEYNTYIGQFLNIARSLAKVGDMPSIFTVRDIFEANNTAYYVTDHVKTITMREFLIRNGGTLSWNQIRPLLMPVLTTLSALHGEGLIHRGLSPETLIVGVDGKIRITGFCVADVRTARSGMNSQLFPGFAAIEQYGFENSQGTWTDVYGLCATLYRILVGSPPADATERVTNDKMIIPTNIAKEIPRNVLTTLADGLAILADDRIRTVAELKTSLIPAAADSAAAGESKSSSRKYVAIAVSATVVIIAVVVFCIFQWVIKPMFAEPAKPSEASAPSSSIAPLVPDPDNPEATYEVFNLVGMSYSDAVTRCGEVFEVKVIECAMSNYEYGQIFEQSIKAGEKKPEGTVIEVKVSIGNGTLSIPKNLTGLSVEEVRLKLLEAGFRAENIFVEGKVSDNIRKDYVVDVEPSSGQKVSMFSTVTIYYSVGNGQDDDDSSSSSHSGSGSSSSKNPSGSSSSKSSSAASSSRHSSSSEGTSSNSTSTR